MPMLLCLVLENPENQSVVWELAARHDLGLLETQPLGLTPALVNSHLHFYKIQG